MYVMILFGCQDAGIPPSAYEVEHIYVLCEKISLFRDEDFYMKNFQDCEVFELRIVKSSNYDGYAQVDTKITNRDMNIDSLARTWEKKGANRLRSQKCKVCFNSSGDNKAMPPLCS
ncbi:hypothetical protein DAI22_03g292500 [Oryza sativa Japonica Group]|nr:uncharacterized protein LOC112938256 [Oryza sativa Japonica Group]KAF2940687.1 hypothetical protein DAI22_03g292500 [Oryza sativa Japonica Group]